MNDSLESSELWQFFAAYFNEDWGLDADGWEGIVDNYVSDDPTAQGLQALAKEMDGVRRAHPEPELKEYLFRTLGCYYSPVDITCEEWLGQVADRLRQHAAAIDNGNPSQH
ncbi:hypothetical protein GGC64_001025 [Mycobacterium sp. OAS707]|uniref:contact-dependent growth inhibition system immunity protein n=1 Tax=Mycobacterium sp. OAS707 TaxID=2663822 RepID=UPI00178ACF04|nr:contact-dependent growth inhibition system immunity protein [Mycobacterium sp. OAS707]MBE1547017.1 hypothetical protein [Mycobacterium sp. OAS707]